MDKQIFNFGNINDILHSIFSGKFIKIDHQRAYPQPNLDFPVDVNFRTNWKCCCSTFIHSEKK